MYTDADRAKALHAESKRLEPFLSGLSPEDCQRPSRCDQWQVADVAEKGARRKGFREMAVDKLALA